MLTRMWRKGNTFVLLVGMQPLWKTVWRFFKKLKIELPHNPAIALYPKDTKIQILRGTFTPMFTTALSIIAKLWKEP